MFSIIPDNGQCIACRWFVCWNPSHQWTIGKNKEALILLVDAHHANHTHKMICHVNQHLLWSFAIARLYIYSLFMWSLSCGFIKSFQDPEHDTGDQISSFFVFDSIYPCCIADKQHIIVHHFLHSMMSLMDQSKHEKMAVATQSSYRSGTCRTRWKRGHDPYIRDHDKTNISTCFI